jgi:hypothetical protein
MNVEKPEHWAIAAIACGLAVLLGALVFVGTGERSSDTGPSSFRAAPVTFATDSFVAFGPSSAQVTVRLTNDTSKATRFFCNLELSTAVRGELGKYGYDAASDFVSRRITSGATVTITEPVRTVLGAFTSSSTVPVAVRLGRASYVYCKALPR